MKRIQITILLCKIAHKNHTTLAAVIKDCNAAIRYAYENRSNTVSSFWKQFGPRNTPPTVYQVLSALLPQKF